MGTITSQTNDNLNFGIKRVRFGQLEIPVDQEMVLTQKITIDAGAEVLIRDGAQLTILGG